MRKLMILLSLLLTSCLKTEIINEVEPRCDTTFTKGIDTTIVYVVVVDTTRIQIGFNPSVEDWEEVNI